MWHKWAAAQSAAVSPCLPQAVYIDSNYNCCHCYNTVVDIAQIVDTIDLLEIE